MVLVACKKVASLKTIRYCCFVLCWSVLLLTIFVIFGGGVQSNNFLYDYIEMDTVPAAIKHSSATRSAAITDSSYADVELRDPHQLNRDRRDDFIDMVRRVEKNMPALPLDFWARQTAIGKRAINAQHCAKLPSILDLEYSNDYWQTQRTGNATFQLFGAYFDNRKTIPDGAVFVRVLGMIDRADMSNERMYCQVWYDQIELSYVVPVVSYKYIWIAGWGNAVDGEYQPYLMSCAVPAEMRDRVPAAVSLVERECDLATNSLRVIYNKPISSDLRQEFAVCVKGLDFLYDDLSVRLVEWIELLGLLGAAKIYFYELQVHPNMRKVLDYYVARGRVEVTKITLPAGKPNFPGLQHLYLSERITQKRQHELIPYNDCLYKNMYRYEYITLLDIDEVIMPKGQLYGWSELMARVRQKAAAKSDDFYPSFDFRNVYFLRQYSRDGGGGQQRQSVAAARRPSDSSSDPPQFMHMLRHTMRARNFSESSDHAKCFHRSDYVLTLHNHFALECLSGYCNTFDTDTEDGQLHHYRKDCVTSSERHCAPTDDVVEDRTVFKYRNKLLSRSMRALHDLGFLKAKTGNGTTLNSGRTSSSRGGPTMDDGYRD